MTLDIGLCCTSHKLAQQVARLQLYRLMLSTDNYYVESCVTSVDLGGVYLNKLTTKTLLD